MSGSLHLPLLAALLLRAASSVEVVGLLVRPSSSPTDPEVCRTRVPDLPYTEKLRADSNSGLVLTTDTHAYIDFTRINVTISTVGNIKVKAILVQAHVEGPNGTKYQDDTIAKNYVPGRFVPSNNHSTLYNCFGAPNSTFLQEFEAPVWEFTAIWIAPAQDYNSLYFRATVMTGENKLIENVDSLVMHRLRPGETLPPWKVVTTASGLNDVTREPACTQEDLAKACSPPPFYQGMSYEVTDAECGFVKSSYICENDMSLRYLMECRDSSWKWVQSEGGDLMARPTCPAFKVTTKRSFEPVTSDPSVVYCEPAPMRRNTFITLVPMLPALNRVPEGTIATYNCFDGYEFSDPMISSVQFNCDTAGKWKSYGRVVECQEIPGWWTTTKKTTPISRIMTTVDPLATTTQWDWWTLITNKPSTTPTTTTPTTTRKPEEKLPCMKASDQCATIYGFMAIWDSDQTCNVCKCLIGAQEICESLVPPSTTAATTTPDTTDLECLPQGGECETAFAYIKIYNADRNCFVCLCSLGEPQCQNLRAKATTRPPTTPTPPPPRDGVPGDHCRETAHCRDTLECLQFMCMCPPGTWYNGRACERDIITTQAPGKLGDKCREESECIQFLDCVRNICTCPPGTQNMNGICVRDRETTTPFIPPWARTTTSSQLSTIDSGQVTVVPEVPAQFLCSVGSLPDVSNMNLNRSSSWLHVVHDMKFRCTGAVNSWTLQHFARTSDVIVAIIRPQGNSRYQLVGVNKLSLRASTDDPFEPMEGNNVKLVTNKYQVPKPNRIYARAGDLAALLYPTAYDRAAVPVLPTPQNNVTLVKMFSQELFARTNGTRRAISLVGIPVTGHVGLTAEVRYRKLCQPPPIIYAAATRRIFIGDSPAPGDRVSYKCFEQHELLGRDESACQYDGSWSTPPSCRIGCGASPIVNRASMTRYTSAPVGVLSIEGDYLEIQCGDSCTLRGPSRTTCGADGLWSQLPYCDCQ